MTLRKVRFAKYAQLSTLRVIAAKNKTKYFGVRTGSIQLPLLLLQPLLYFCTDAQASVRTSPAFAEAWKVRLIYVPERCSSLFFGNCRAQ